MAETQNTGQFAKTIVTDVGKDMIAKSQNGQTLTFSRVALGDGLVGEEEDVTKFTAVKNERLSLPIAKYSNLGNGQFQIQFRLTNSQVESGFWHREIGIMAKIDNGQEQLYAYTTAGNKASFIYDKTTPVEERIVNVNFVIGNAQNLEVIINSSVIYATIEDLEEALDAHDAGADAHEPAFDAHNAADDAHKDFTGATAEAAGKRGMVPAPATGDQNKALFGDATYKQVVQKVNGVAPDSGGNVTIDIPEPVIASEAEAKAGTNNTKFMTPLRVAQAIDALDGNPITGASISGKTITLTKKDGTKITLTTQDTAPFTGRATTIGGASTTKPAVIVETEMSGANWYRRWSDGWLEQGGVVNMPISSATGQKTVTLLKAYKNTNYVLTALPDLTNTDSASAHIELDVTYVNKTTTKFTLQGYLYDYSSTADMNWYTCGQGA